MANIIQGQDFHLFTTTGATSGVTGYTVLACATSCKLTLSGELQDITNKDSGLFVEKAPKRFSWNASSDNMFEVGNVTNGYDMLFAKMIAKTPVNVGFNTKTGSNMSAGAYVGKAYITSLDLNASDNDNVTFSVSLEGSGALTKLA